MSEIEQALERLGNAVDKLQDKLARSTPAAANLGSAPSEETVSVANPINFDELHIIKKQVSTAISLIEQRISVINNSAATETSNSKNDRQSGEW